MPYSFIRTVIPIALIFSFRMLGLFMLIPVFSVLALDLKYASPILIGVALGAYGLSQGLLQLPFGMVSDKFGRKPVIALGLVLFGLGSVLGALTTSIYGMIIARTIQGTGAVGSVLIALTADLTSDEHRTKGMAVIGMCIGMSFALAMVISPLIARYYGLQGIFFTTMLLAVCGLILLFGLVPSSKTIAADGPSVNSVQFDWKKVLNNSSLMTLNASIFIQHFLLTTTFFAVPLILNQPQEGHPTQSWTFYLPVMLVAFLLMIPLIMIAERKNRMKTILNIAVITGLLSQLMLAQYSDRLIAFTFLMTVYFTGFNLLEACLPSLVSKHAPAELKGMAMGVYSSTQFLGIFFGGLCSGILYKYFNTTGIFYVNAAIGILWLALLWRFNPLNYTLSISLNLHNSIDKEALLKNLSSVFGVAEVITTRDGRPIAVKTTKAQEQQVLKAIAKLRQSCR